LSKPPSRPKPPRKSSNGATKVSATKTAPGESNPTTSSITPVGTLGGARGLLQQRMGQLTLAMLRLARYKGLSIADLDLLALRPLLNDRVAFAHGEGEDTSAMPLGMAIWASVSDAVGAKIAEQVNAGAFPLRLAKDDWTSGDNVWLLDIVVPTKRAGTSVFMNFGSLIGGRSFRMHPVVLQSVDRSIVDKISSVGQGTVPDTSTTH
jgi:cytolysin-activating lysine-acyltransferase